MHGDSLPPGDSNTQSPNLPANQSLGQRQLAAEQMRLLYHSFPFSLFASLIIAAMLSISHWEVIAQREIILWNLLLGSVLLVRLILWLCWHNLQQLYPASFWLNTFRLGVWATGGAWGAAALLIFAQDNNVYQALLAFTLAGVATGSITSLSVDKLSSVGFVIFTISPLSIIIYLQDGPTALAMSGMTLLFIFFVITSATRTRSVMADQLNKQFNLLQITEELNRKQQQDSIINNAQSIYISENNIEAALQNLLQDTLPLCNSELGFIGQVDKDHQEQPYMRALVFASQKKNDLNLKLFRESNLPPKGEYRNLDTIFGTILKTGKPLISSNISRDLRAANLPKGHPGINSFIGIPIFNGKEQVAILGLANAPEGYNNDMVVQLTSILKSIAQFVLTINHEQQHQRDKAALEASNQHTQTILNDIADGIITINKHGIIDTFNHAAETIFGYRASQIIGKNVSELMPEPYKTMHDGYLQTHIQTNKKNIIGIGREVIGLRRNGSEFPMDLMVSRVFQKGEPVFIGIVRDITEKKRTNDLRTQFISAASREILGPLNLVSEAINLLHKDGKILLPDNLFHLVEIAQENSSRLQKLMSDLIEMQTISKPDITFNLSSLATQPLIEEVINQNKAFCDISLKTTSASLHNLMIHTDGRAFVQALSHLIQYLQKISTQKCSIGIAIAESRGHITITLRVQNTLIRSDIKQKLTTEKGQQQQLENAGYYAGDELGLAIAKEIIEKMHGKVELLNTNDELNFVLHFPLALHNT